MEMRSSLGRVRGLGSAKEGVHHWRAQRITAIALVPLSLWFAFSVTALVGADYETFRAWLGQFGNGLLMLLLMGVLYYHAMLGMQVVIEDYVAGEGAKMTTLLVMKLLLFVLAASCALAILRIVVGS